MTLTQKTREHIAQQGHLDRPYFVYGTLRPGEGNDKLWLMAGATCHHDGEAYALGYQMYASGIPYAVPTGDGHDKVWGAIIKPSPTVSEQLELRMVLDALEGHPEHYTRVEAYVSTPEGPMNAWIYSMSNYAPHGDRVPSGDFKRRNEPKEEPVTETSVEVRRKIEVVHFTEAIWCHYHGEAHEPIDDIYNETPEGEVVYCERANWAPLFIEAGEWDPGHWNTNPGHWDNNKE